MRRRLCSAPRRRGKRCLAYSMCPVDTHASLLTLGMYIYTYSICPVDTHTSLLIRGMYIYAYSICPVDTHTSLFTRGMYAHIRSRYTDAHVLSPEVPLLCMPTCTYACMYLIRRDARTQSCSYTIILPTNQHLNTHLNTHLNRAMPVHIRTCPKPPSTARAHTRTRTRTRTQGGKLTRSSTVATSPYGAALANATGCPMTHAPCLVPRPLPQASAATVSPNERP